MAKARTSYLCRACGGAQARWVGKCPDCGAWDSLEKFVEREDPHGALADAWSSSALPGLEGGDADSTGFGLDGAFGEGPDGSPAPTVRAAAGALPLSEIPPEEVPRRPTGVAELDRVLGGGLVAGSVVLLGGDPGVGKSTLLLHALAGLAAGSGARPILYVSSEESAGQVRLRAERLASAPAPAALHVLAETNLLRIAEQVRKLRPAACAIDSVQMVYRSDLPAAPGSVAQLRRCCQDLVYLAKRSGMAVVLVGHVTKDGNLAGPKLLEHLVDVVLSFEGDRHHACRIVRAVKNRFGATQEIGLFEMGADGLREIAEGVAPADPNRPPPAGAVACPTILGSRCLLAEVQALTAPGVIGAARRRVSGLDANRLAMLVAVLERHGGLRLADQEIFAAVAGGLRVLEPAADLAIALAIAGVHLGRGLPAGTAVAGEVGLAGQVRSAPQVAQRVRESTRLGYRTILLPAADRTAARPALASGAEVVWVDSVAEALDCLAPRAASVAAAAPLRQRT